MSYDPAHHIHVVIVVSSLFNPYLTAMAFERMLRDETDLPLYM